MKKILLLGKFNDVVKDVIKALSEEFFVQACELRVEAMEGMLKVIEPDLVLISLVGAQDYDKAIFRKLSVEYEKIPVLTLGTESEKKHFLDYYQDEQFKNIIRPVDNETILKAVCERLELVYKEKEDAGEIKDRDRKRNVLIVDDNAVTLRSIKGMLEGEFDITLATSGMQALTAIGKKRPDLILLDYEMPICDGKQTLEMIRADEEYKNIPVIFLTAIKDRPHIEAVVGLKPAGYLLKPADKNKLIETINKTLYTIG